VHASHARALVLRAHVRAGHAGCRQGDSHLPAGQVLLTQVRRGPPVDAKNPPVFYRKNAPIVTHPSSRNAIFSYFNVTVEASRICDELKKKRTAGSLICIYLFSIFNVYREASNPTGRSYSSLRTSCHFVLKHCFSQLNKRFKSLHNQKLNTTWNFYCAVCCPC
jgi:hypothetical protein